MFETFVIGPIAAAGGGIVHQCIDCRKSAGAPPQCTGFGVGCLVSPAPRAPVAEPVAPARRAAQREPAPLYLRVLEVTPPRTARR
jgi:hypothetical protein